MIIIIIIIIILLMIIINNLLKKLALILEFQNNVDQGKKFCYIYLYTSSFMQLLRKKFKKEKKHNSYGHQFHVDHMFALNVYERWLLWGT